MTTVVPFHSLEKVIADSLVNKYTCNTFNIGMDSSDVCLFRTFLLCFFSFHLIMNIDDSFPK